MKHPQADDVSSVATVNQQRALASAGRGKDLDRDRQTGVRISQVLTVMARGLKPLNF